ncbi:MAG: SAM-dependent methyltransferase, partial [uncultured Thermomicrobiales bacterium]
GRPDAPLLRPGRGLRPLPTRLPAGGRRPADDRLRPHPRLGRGRHRRRPRQPLAPLPGPRQSRGRGRAEPGDARGGRTPARRPSPLPRRRRPGRSNRVAEPQRRPRRRRPGVPLVRPSGGQGRVRPHPAAARPDRPRLERAAHGRHPVPGGVRVPPPGPRHGLRGGSPPGRGGRCRHRGLFRPSGFREGPVRQPPDVRPGWLDRAAPLLILRARGRTAGARGDARRSGGDLCPPPGGRADRIPLRHDRLRRAAAAGGRGM